MEKIIIEIPAYIRKVKLSESRLTKYYQKGKTPPKAQKYLDRTLYGWKKLKGKEYLCDLTTGERVVANPRAAGTPRYVTINGQKIYNGEISMHIRNKVLGEIKDSFAPFINNLAVIDKDAFPLVIQMELHDTIREDSSKALWDVDNRAWPYIKAFQDCLTGNKDKKGKMRNKQVIPDDNVLFITQPPVPKFIPVEDESNRKLVFIITSETDKRITQDKEFCRQLKVQLDDVSGLYGSSQQNMEERRWS